MQGWQYDKGLIYFRPIFWLVKLAFFRARAKKELTSRFHLRLDLCIQRFLLLEVYFTTFLCTISNQSLPKNAKNVVSASYPDDYPDVSLWKKMPPVPFPWSLAIHHQSLASGWLYMPLIPENQVLRDRRRGGARGALPFPASLCEIICSEIAA